MDSPSPPSGSPARGATAHLLVVDDEPVILQILRAVFEDQPYRLTTVGTGNDARRVIEEQGCDILVTDKNLPDVGGLVLLELAKQRDPTTEVIVVTGYGSLETAIQAMELGAYDYVLKPLNNVFEIRRKVERALDRQRIARENARLLVDLKDKNDALQVALDEARELQAELIQSEKLAGIGTLAAGVAHEISSPLFGIMGLAEAILDESEPELTREYAGDIVEYCRNIRDIVVELSGYSRAASGEYQTTVDVAKVAEDAVKLVQRTAPTDGIEVELALTPGAVVQARVNEVQQVFVNLFKNACEAVREHHPDGGGKVRVQVDTEPGAVRASVRDNGTGIPNDKLGIVFDPFYTTKPPGKGTGLGLNVVWRIVTKYRGSVQVESGVGDGTTFRIKLPAAS
ncbi:MAG: response regulator [Alphaproteobacteria bacterium]|nr:response regulator [Alphaproteobacteria bacterium]